MHGAGRYGLQSSPTSPAAGDGRRGHRGAVEDSKRERQSLRVLALMEKPLKSAKDLGAGATDRAQMLPYISASRRT